MSSTPQESAEDTAQRKKMRDAQINKDLAAANNYNTDTLAKYQDMEIQTVKALAEAVERRDNAAAANFRSRLIMIDEQIKNSWRKIA